MLEFLKPFIHITKKQHLTENQLFIDEWEKK